MSYNRVESIEAKYNYLYEYDNYNHQYYDSNNLGTFATNFPMLGSGINVIGSGKDSSKRRSSNENKNTINKSKSNRQGNVNSTGVLDLSGDNNGSKHDKCCDNDSSFELFACLFGRLLCLNIMQIYHI